MNVQRPLALFTFAFAATLAPLSHASFTAAVVPAFRSGPCSHVAGWESFTQAHTLPNAPDVAITTATSATLRQLTPSAFLTSGGNIYDPINVTSYEVTDTTSADAREVVLQVSTNGNPRDYTSFELRYVDALGATVVLAASDLQVLVQAGQHEELYVRWNLEAVADDVFAFTVAFHGAAPSMSLDAVWLDVRELCPPGTPFCFGDGSFADHTSPCPCANNGAPGHGCAHSFDPAGAQLVATGTTAANDVVLTSTNTPATSFTLFLQHDASADATFHDGTLCAGGSLVRLRGRAAVAGSASFPNNAFAQDLTTTLSQRGGVTPGSSALRYYSAWFRNASTTFCPPATANVSNGWRITW